MTATRKEIDAILGQHKGSRHRLWLAVAAVLLLVAGLWGYSVITSRGATDPGYVTEPVRRTDIVVRVAATGSVEPTNLVDISSELSGTIRTVEVDFNDTVHRGQVLARLDTQKLEATLEHAQASLAAREAMVAQANATLDETRAAYERTRQLESRGMVSEEALLRDKAAYERAQAALSAAQADVRVAQASLRMDEADLARACICSPIDGVVLERSVEPGQIVAASFQAPVLFTLAEDLAQMELRVDIDEADIGRVKPGDSASFSVEAYQDMSFPAEISELRYAPKTVDGVVTYEAILSVDNSRLLLRPGMTATAEITVDEVSDVLAIPNAALRFTPPVADSGDAGEDQRSGLLGMIFRPPSRSPATVPQAEAGPDGRRTVWLLRAGIAEPVDILPGVSDGLVTEVRQGAVTVGDPVITDMADER